LRPAWKIFFAGGVSDITLYDPGYAPYRELPTRTLDGVISTYVLEHCPEEDIDWILDEISGFSTKFVFCTVAFFPANKSLPNSDNSHITLKSMGWWADKFEETSRRHDRRKYQPTAIRTPSNMIFI